MMEESMEEEEAVKEEEDHNIIGAQEDLRDKRRSFPSARLSSLMPPGRP